MKQVPTKESYKRHGFEVIGSETWIDPLRDRKLAFMDDGATVACRFELENCKYTIGPPHEVTIKSGHQRRQERKRKAKP